MTRPRRLQILPGFGLSLGMSLLFVALILLLPLSGLALNLAQLTLADYWNIVSDGQTLAALRVTAWAAAWASLFNALFGLLLAWVLTRYRFPGRVFVDALVDLPFALPTAVAGIALATLFAADGWLGQPLAALGIAIACVFVNKMGKELKDDPEYQRRLKDPVYQEIYAAQESSSGTETVINEKSARTSLKIFISAAILVVILGSLDKLAKYLPAELMAHLRPSFPDAKGDMKLLNMPHVIEIVMLTAAAFIITFCKPDGTAITRGSVFHAGMRAVIAIFGIAWLGDTLFNAHLDELKTLVSGLVETAPWTFAFALFAFSVLVNSQGATVATLFPLGVSLGIPPEIMVGTFVAVNGYFFIPNYGPIIASIDFDTTGTTRIGRYILNHSFMIPGLLSMAFSLVLGLAFAKMLL